jgi:hypothetical protein
MIEVTKSDAKKLFSQGKKLFILPSNINHGHETFYKLTLQKDFYNREYPDERVKEYARLYCNATNGHEIKFYYSPLKVLLSRTGTGFEIKHIDSRERLYIVRGGDAKLVSFVNSRFLMVANAGYLTAPFKQKIKYYTESAINR